MRPILTLNDSRLQVAANRLGLLATNGKVKRVFRLEALPKGWKLIKSIPVGIPGLTPDQCMIYLNRRLGHKLPTAVVVGERIYDKQSESLRIVKSVTPNGVELLSGETRTFSQIINMGKL